MIGNQKGGVGKTTTAITLSRCLADLGLRTLLVDGDPQGSVAVTLKLKPENYLSDFILSQLRLQDCVAEVAPNMHVLCGNRETSSMEQRLFTSYGREHVFQKAFKMYEDLYDAIIVDVAPSISLLQACSMVFCQNILIPVSMDTLSVSGAGATIFSARTIAESVDTPIRIIGLLPTIMNRRFGLTDVVMKMINQVGQNYGIPVLEPIRTDQSVGKAGRVHKMIADIEPASKALEDYHGTALALLKLFGMEEQLSDAEVRKDGHVSAVAV